MSVAPILPLRKAIVAHLRADSAVTSTSIGARIYGERPAVKADALTWPFMLYGTSDAQPGHEITVPLHIFSKAEFTDDVNAIAEAIATSLDDKKLTLGDGRNAYLTWSSVRVVGDEDEWHAIVTVSARVPRDCS